MIWSLGKTNGMEIPLSEQWSPEVSALPLAPPTTQVGFPRSHQLGLDLASPREIAWKVALVQDLQRSCWCCPHCYSSTCWFRNSCSQVILGLLTLGFLSCTYKWPACSFHCCVIIMTSVKSVISQRFWWPELGKWCLTSDFCLKRWYFEV